MQEELKHLQRQLGITFIFVTHDQGEALSMADRVAIFNEGKIVQAGPPSEIYDRPRSRFVADFVGSSNVMSPEFSKSHGGPDAWVSLRPEKIKVSTDDHKVTSNQFSAEGQITAIQYQGAVTRVVIDAKGTRLSATQPATSKNLAEGQTVRFTWAQDSIVEMEKA